MSRAKIVIGLVVAAVFGWSVYMGNAVRKLNQARADVEAQAATRQAEVEREMDETAKLLGGQPR
ncbi:MAG TPA: hypothetical protein VNA25_18125 [Phycisphaerae bacterium]|nr:hypothetical protein [Phycisphaerae bacterium]